MLRPRGCFSRGRMRMGVNGAPWGIRFFSESLQSLQRSQRFPGESRAGRGLQDGLDENGDPGYKHNGKEARPGRGGRCECSVSLRLWEGVRSLPVLGGKKLNINFFRDGHTAKSND
jgi:hypothetical protein